MTTLDSAKNAQKNKLQKNVTSFLTQNYDWKVARSVTTGTALTDADRNFRASIVAEYNNRVALVTAADSIAAVNAVSTVFP